MDNLRFDRLCVCNRLPQLHEFSQELCGVTIPPMMFIPVAQWAAVTGLAEKWIAEQAEYPTAEVHAAAAVRLCARELRKVIGGEA